MSLAQTAAPFENTESFTNYNDSTPIAKKRQTISHNKTDLLGNQIWLTEGKQYTDNEIITSTRIGVEYAGEDALLPWRFHIKDNKYVSK